MIGFRKKYFTETEINWNKSFNLNGSISEYDWPDVDIFDANSIKPAPNGIVREITVQHWFEKNDVENHKNAQHFFKPRTAIKKIKKIGEGDTHKKSFKRLHRWRFSPTAAYGNNEVHLHPYKERRISVSEALAIQSLPAGFELPGTMTLTDMFKCIGNGVPYLVARDLAQEIKTHIEKNLLKTSDNI